MSSFSDLLWNLPYFVILVSTVYALVCRLQQELLRERGEGVLGGTLPEKAPKCVLFPL